MAPMSASRVTHPPPMPLPTRIRLSTAPPLPPLRVWVPLPAVSSVREFKLFLIQNIPLLSSHSTPDALLSLELDAFQLLDDSHIDVLRDGDLLLLKVITIPAKRNAPLDISESNVPKKRRFNATATLSRLGLNQTTAPSVPNHSSSPSTTSSSGSSSPSSSSSTDSDSGSDSSAPSIHASAQTKTFGVPSLNLRKPNITPTVPPGQGKPETHERNLRRRKKRLLQKLNEGYPLSQLEDEIAKSTPFPSNTVSAATPIIGPSIAANLHNKNKRKGFKQAMQPIIPQRIIFADSQPRREFVPPSECSDLPENIFVTSVDVEEGLWPKRNARKKRSGANTLEEKGEDIQLPYGEEERSESELDWEQMEAQMETYVKIEDWKSLAKEDVIVWKELDIDPKSLTPQLLLKTARIVGWNEEKRSVMVENKRRVNGEVAFGGIGEDTTEELGTEELDGEWFRERECRKLP